MQPSLTEATTEEKTNTCTDRRHPTYNWSPQIIQEKLDSRKRRKDKKTSNGQGSLGH